MKKFYLLLGFTLCLCCFVNFTYAQEAASATWPLTNPASPTFGTGQAVTITGQITAQNEKLANTSINGYSGTDASQRVQILGGTWPAGQTDTITGTYIQFEVSPVAGNALDVKSIAFKIGGGGGSGMRAKAFFSTDPSFKTATLITELATQMAALTSGNLSSSALLSINRSTNITLPEGKSLYVRVYPWYTSTSTGKYVVLKDVVISGESTPAGTPVTMPVVATVSPATSITVSAATVAGNVTTDGGAAVTARGIAYATTENPTTANNTMAAGAGTGEFSADLTELMPATTYYARAYATNSAGTSYGDQVSFSTLTPATVPTVTTNTVTEITLTSATVAGNVTADGGATVTARGISYATTENPTTADNTMAAGTGTGEFSAQLSGLTPGTTYYARSYATNSAGTSYGEPLSFTTLAPIDLPTVTTTAVTDITTTTAQSGGNVTATGGADVTARGVVWSTSENPTTADNKTEDGSGEGSFTSQFTGLSAATTYYVRAYATNSAGTAYGEQRSFTTEPAAPTVKKVLYLTMDKGLTPANVPNWDANAAPQDNDAIIQMLKKDSNFEVTVRVLTGAEAGAAATAVDMAPYDVVIVQESLGGSSAILTPAGSLGLSKFTKPTIYNKPFALASTRAFAVTSPVTPGTGIDASTVGTTSGGITTPGVSILNMTVPVANRTNALFNGINFTDEAGTMRIFRNGATDNGGTPTGTAAAKGFSYNNVVVLDPTNRTLAEFPATADRSIAATGTPVFFNDIPANTKIGTETTKARMIMMGMNYGAINKDAGTNITSQGLTLWRNAIYSLAGLPVPTTAVAPFVTAPVVTTAAATNLTTVSVQSGGNVTSARGADVTARGVVWSTTENPTTADSKTMDGTGEGSFTSQLTGLAPATTYYLRSYATNTESTSYGSQVTVTTLTPAVLATLSTTEVSEVTTTTAQSGGNVTATGGAPITARGIVWSTSQNPTTADSKTEDGTGEGSFTSQLTGLTAATTYYVRAYATNSAGTAYGEQRNFTTAAAPVTLAPASATWPLSSATQQAATTSGQVNATAQQLGNMTINQYTGPGGSQRVQIAGGSWPANQTDMIAGTYVQFAVMPKPNNKLHVNNVSFNMGTAGGIGTMKAKVFYSTDPAFATSTAIEYTTGNASNYLNSSDVLTAVNATMDVVVENGETFYLRIYPWIEDPTARTGKYIALKDVVIAGGTEALPVASSVVWASDQSFTTTGAVTGAAPAYSAAMKYYGAANPLPTTDTNEEVRGMAIQTVSQDWQAEPNPVETLWFQYAVSPKTGATLNVTNVSMYIGGWFSSNLKAAVYYSKDPTFAQRTLLVPDMALPGNKMAPVSADLNETVNTGETFYVRIYPHNTQAEGWAKLVSVYNMRISGTAIGATVDPSTVVTVSPATEISTTFATVGGNITSDGGSPVSARGIAWGTTENPTIANNITAAGTGSGAFSAQLTGLTAGTTYYARAFATNEAGTSYGQQVSFATLATLAVPTVTTTAVSSILTKTAQSGGNVTAWGGAPVTARGLVWNTTGNPTVADSKTEAGTGIGSFGSQLFNLNPQTTYYVRAYATNSQGTGYGPEVTFTTQQPAPDVTKVVAQDGSGDYLTVQAAFNAVPDFYTGKWTILVKPGTYKEKLILTQNKVNVILRGENPFTTILTYDDYAGKNNLGTSGSYSVAIDADDFIAANITFQNTKKNDNTQQNEQAVALRTNGDRQAYYNCRILGYQDTFYAWGGRVVGRIYMKNCYIEGSVDFIFGRDIVVFDNCTINVNRNGGMLTAASTEANTRHGFVFLNSTVTADAVGFDGTPITSFHLGRPWQQAPRTVFMNTFLPATLNPAGWQTWNTTPALYGEYNNSGPGASLAGRSPISRALTAAEAADHTIAKIFAKETHPAFSYDWMPENVNFPVTSISAETRNAAFSLGQNYPNPFRTTTTITFELKNASQLTLEVYDVTGRRVAVLAEGLQQAGSHEVKVNNNFQDGVYFYKLTAGGITATRRMVITR